MDLFTGVEDSHLAEVIQENGMGRPATAGESPVSEREGCETGSRVPRDT